METKIENDANSASAPQIAVDASGNAIAAWVQIDNGILSIWTNRYDVTTGLWDTPAVIESDSGAGHFAFAPQIGIDASGNAIAVWRQSNGTVYSIWANRYDVTTGLWGMATEIETDNNAGHTAHDPQIGVDASGNAIAVWRQSNGTFVSIWANRYNVTTGLWGTAALIENDNNNADNPQIGVDASGNAIAVWHQDSSTVDSIWANRYDVTTGLWGTAVLIEADNALGHDADKPQIGVDVSGNAIAVWRQSNSTVDSIWANRYDVTTGLWGTAARVEADNTLGHDADKPQIGVDVSGNAIAVWRQFQGTVDSIWANRYDATTGLWGIAEEIEADNTVGHNAYQAQIGVGASGTAISVWHQFDGTDDSVWANHFK